jgi:hypothetical protein
MLNFLAITDLQIGSTIYVMNSDSLEEIKQIANERIQIYRSGL